MEDKRETEYMHEKWEKGFVKLENDLEKFRNYFNNTKKCKCDIDECKHYENAKHKVFSDRIDELWNLRLQVGFRTLNSIYGNNR